MLLFVSKDMSFSPERKAVLFEMLSDPEKAKEDFIYLLEWFYENAFSVIEPKLERMLPEVATDLKKEIEASGIKFLKTLIKNIDYTSYEVLERTVICPSYFSEFLVSNAAIPFVKEDMYTAGFRFTEVITIPKNQPETSADTFNALAHEKKLALIRHLSMGQSSGHELARALDLSNFEIGEHIDILREAGMVSVEKMNQMMYFSLNKEAESLKIGRALEDFIEVNEG